MDISRKRFWHLLKTYKTILRMKRAKIVRTGYSMPYGGRAETNTYKLYDIHFTQTQ